MREVGKVRFSFQKYRLESSLKEGSDTGMAQVEIIGVARPQFSHKLRDPVLGYLTDHDMVMIGHETERKNLYERLTPCLKWNFKQGVAV